jgi:hypothetical protein
MKTLMVGLLFSASLAFGGDLFTIGVKAGVPLEEAFDAASNGNVRYITNTKHYTVGPELDINLPLGLAVEVDALYRRLDYESFNNEVDAFVHSATTANAWDFPVLLKWGFKHGPIRPYIGAGPTFRGVTNIKQIQQFFLPPGGVNTSSGPAAELQHQFATGFTAAGGVRLFGHVSPEIRYTRWGWDSFRDVSGLLRSNPDQVDFMLGLTF